MAGRYSGYNRERVLLDDEGIQVLVAFLAVLGVIYMVWTVARPMATVVRHEVVASRRDGCQAAVWVSGEHGDRLARLVNTRKYGPATLHSVVIIPEHGTSVRTPTRIATEAGNCEVVRWHLLIDGQDVGNVTKF